MLSNILIAIEITALGMALVFAAIVLLWLMMWVLTAIQFKDSESTKEAQRQTAEEETLMIQAAAVAVAIALAEQSQSSARPLSQPPTALVSAWQLGMRSRQMYEKGGR